MNYTLFSNPNDAIDSLMARAEADVALRPELDAQLADIYDAVADPSLRDYACGIDAAIDSHIALADSMQSRAELLDALMGEYGKRMAMAMAASRTFVDACYQRPRCNGEPGTEGGRVCDWHRTRHDRWHSAIAMRLRDSSLRAGACHGRGLPGVDSQRVNPPQTTAVGRRTGFSRGRGRGRGSDAAPSPATPSR